MDAESGGNGNGGSALASYGGPGGVGPGGDYESRMAFATGKGKPMTAMAPIGGKRGRRGYGIVGRGGRAGPVGAGNNAMSPTGAGTSALTAAAAAIKGGGPNKPGVISSKKRANEARRRGRQPKIRGMVGLQVSKLYLFSFLESLINFHFV